MGKFNWNDYEVEQAPGQKQAQVQPSSSFSWGDYEVEEPAPSKPSISKSESAARGTAQGATFGFADEIAGGVEALWEKAKGDPTEFGKLYATFRDESRENFKKAKEANPKSYLTGEIGGSVASAFVPGLGQAGTVGKMAMTGAKVGGLTAAGNSEADNLKDLTTDTLIGSGTGLVGGALVGGATQMASPAVNWAGKKIGSGAEYLAAKALGAERGTAAKIGADKLKQAGRQALDEKIISPLAGTQKMIQRNEAVRKKGGKLMGEVYEAIDKKGASTFNPLDTAVEVENKIGKIWRSPINKGEANQFENTIESILMRGDKNISLKEAQILKEEIGSVANWNSKAQLTDKEKMARDAYKVVSDQIDKAVDAGSEIIEKAGLTKILNQGKALVSGSKTAKELLKKKSDREFNKVFGLTDTITGGAALTYGGGTGDWEGAGGIVLAKKALGKYGAQNTALLLDKMSKALIKGSPEAAQAATKNPVAFRATVSQLIRKASDKVEMSRAAQNEEKPLKGPKKWANEGFNKLSEHIKDPQQKRRLELRREQLMNSPAGRRLLIQASDHSPGSKAMENLLQNLSQKAE